MNSVYKKSVPEGVLDAPASSPYLKTPPKGELDTPENTSISQHWTYVGAYSEGLAAVRDSSDKYGYIDQNGKVIIPCTWDDADFFVNGFALVKGLNGKWGCIDRSGTLILPCTWDTGYVWGGKLTLENQKYRFFYTEIEKHSVTEAGKAKWESTKKEWHTGRAGTGRWG